MLPRINSGEVLSVTEPRQSDNDDTVLVPKSVQEGLVMCLGAGVSQGAGSRLCVRVRACVCARVSLSSLAHVALCARARGVGYACVRCMHACTCRTCVPCVCVCVCVCVCAHVQSALPATNERG